MFRTFLQAKAVSPSFRNLIAAILNKISETPEQLADFLFRGLLFDFLRYTINPLFAA